MKLSSPAMLIVISATLGCSSLSPAIDKDHFYQELPDGTAVKIITDHVHHPPAKFYVEIGPDYKKSNLIKPERNEESYLNRWYNIGRIVCEGKEPVPAYGPRTDGPYLLDLNGQPLCKPRVGEADCGPVVFGYFHCGSS